MAEATPERFNQTQEAMIPLSLDSLSLDELQKREGLLKRLVSQRKNERLIDFKKRLENEQAFLEFSEETDELERNYNSDTVASASRALIYAAALGKIEIAQNLIKNHGADVNFRNEDKETPFLISLKRKRLKMAEWLLKNGVNLQINKQENDVKKIVCENGFISILPILKKHGVDFSKPYTRTLRRFAFFPIYRVNIYPIIVAAFSQQTKLVKELLKTPPSSEQAALMARALRSSSHLTKEIKILFLKALVQRKSNQIIQKQISRE